MTPSISVCIPTYNGEKYLTACLDSVAAQTYADFEALVVDDLSFYGHYSGDYECVCVPR